MSKSYSFVSNKPNIDLSAAHHYPVSMICARPVSVRGRANTNRMKSNGIAKVNKVNDEQIERSCWPLYHGTSTRRLKEIRRENCLRMSATGERKIALTTERSVADYFACNAVFGDLLARPGEKSEPVLLILDGEALVADHYELEGYRDTIMGDGECDWENEIACWSDIDDLTDVLLSIEPVSKSRWEIHRTVEDRGQRTKHFKPAGPRLADYELAIMIDTVDRLEEGDITAIRAEAIIAAMCLVWTVLRSDETRADDLQRPFRR